MSGVAPAGGGDDGFRLERGERWLSLRAGGTELFRYLHDPGDPQVESPRPYFHPLRTLDGDVVTDLGPDDHPWHKGLSLALPNVGEANFWGGVTYRRGLGYVQLPNNGAVRHVAYGEVTAAGRTARFDQALTWVTEAGETWLEEDRAVASAPLPSERAWVLAFRTRLRNVRGAPVAFGSPTTEGRPLAGYGGLFWRGPRSFAGGTVTGPGGAGGEAMMGARAGWLAFTGRHGDPARASTVVFVDHPANPGHPTEWFVRSRPYACACPAPFFSAEQSLAPGAVLTLRYDLVVADGAWDPDRTGDVVRRRVRPVDLLGPGRG